MKFYLKLIIASIFVIGCKSYKNITPTTDNTINKVVIDAYNTTKDKAHVSFYPSTQSKNEVLFFLPKIIPGTYSIDNYGQFIENLKALDATGKELKVIQLDTSSWKISSATKLHKIEYSVNDSFDIENKHDVFSPAGTNIEHHRNYILNLHGFVGYIENEKNQPFQLKVKHHKNLHLGCSYSIKSTKKNNDIKKDTFMFDRYASLIDNPIFLSRYPLESFNINDITVTIGVHAPNKSITAKDLLPSMQKMMTAQKHFMGEIDHTHNYSIFLYLANNRTSAPHGFGALEHDHSTVVVLPAQLPFKAIERHMIDIVSHEFFHIITPLAIHSKEIHDFDYHNPKMSKHLWMYEGVTEYFAQLFQVTEGLISRDAFFDRISKKISHSKKYSDDLSFTEMSKHVLEEHYKEEYNNVYEKGALIAMCIDILIREESNGTRTILDMMKTLSKTYGKNRAFDDEELFDVVKGITYQSVYDFLKEHVEKGTPIDYNVYLNKIGASLNTNSTSTGYFQNGETYYISPENTENHIYFNELVVESAFLKQLGIQKNDILVAVNGKKFDLNNASYLLEISKRWQKGTLVSFKVKRGLEIMTFNTTIEKSPSVKSAAITFEPAADNVKYL